MSAGKVKLGISIPGNALFEALRGSGYMRGRGYAIIRATTTYARTSTVKVMRDVEIEEKSAGERAIEHRICYEHPVESNYVHIHEIAPEAEATELNYLITLGDLETILEDLANLVLELNKKFEQPPTTTQ